MYIPKEKVSLFLEEPNFIVPKFFKLYEPFPKPYIPIEFAPFNSIFPLLLLIISFVEN